MLKLKAGKKAANRTYPKKYEKTVPWVIGLIGIVILALLIIIVLVMAGTL